MLSRGFACLAEVDAPTDGTAYEVDCWAVDDLCAARGIEAVRYLKLDVEGAELIALEGASRMLGAASIDYVLVETQFGNPVAAGIDRLLTGHGYRPFRPDSTGKLRPVTIATETGRFDVIWVSPKAEP